jgi:hypothetical protein
MHKGLAILLLAFAIPTGAQMIVAPTETASVRHALDSHQKKHSLDCFVEPWGPSLDFNFFYQTGYQLSIDMKQLTPGEAVDGYLRVTPQGGAPVLLEQPIAIPAEPKDSLGTFQSLNRRRFQLTGLGRFSVGEGKYSVELLALSAEGRSCYQQWKIQTKKYPDASVPPAMAPRSVAPMRPIDWDGKLDPNGVRLSVLLDAAPLNRFAARLHSSDRAFSLQALRALLNDLPCQSVQVVAFNLDQQTSIFRQEQFDSSGFAKLTLALQGLQLSTVPIESLKRGTNMEYLRQLTREQVASGQFDAVVFLGPNLQATYDNPQMPPLEKTSTRIFYFEGYAPITADPPPQIAARYLRVMQPENPFPDSIEYLTKQLHGSVFHITTAKDLAVAIPKMLAQLRPTLANFDQPGH